MEDRKTRLQDEGFSVIPKIFSEHELYDIRRNIRACFKNTDYKRYMSFSTGFVLEDALAFPELQSIVANPRLVSAVRTITGIQNPTFTMSGSLSINRLGGWHSDGVTSTLRDYSISTPGCRVFTVGIYPQRYWTESEVVHGIRFKKRSHLSSEEDENLQEEFIYMDDGDVAIWNVNVLHTGREPDFGERCTMRIPRLSQKSRVKLRDVFHKVTFRKDRMFFVFTVGDAGDFIQTYSAVMLWKSTIRSNKDWFEINPSLVGALANQGAACVFSEPGKYRLNIDADRPFDIQSESNFISTPSGVRISVSDLEYKLDR